MAQSATPWWQVFVDTIERMPRGQQAERFAALSIELSSRNESAAAAAQALRAWQAARESGAPSAAVVEALAAVTPRFHAQISTDPLRIATWNAALAAVVKPGMLALEVGTGSGVIAMLAARSGAMVVSCEIDRVIATVAEAIVQHNGLTERIRIIGKPVEDLHVPQDLSRPADLLMLDVFGDNLFDFKPFQIVRTARTMLRRDAICMPARVSLEAALVDFQYWPRIVPGSVAGLDISLLGDVTSRRMPFAHGDATLRSAQHTMVDATLPETLPPEEGTAQQTLVSNGGIVNGVAIWLRLELAPGHVLEAHPQTAPANFYAKPRFNAFRQALDTRPGQTITISLKWKGKRLSPAELVRA